MYCSKTYVFGEKEMAIVRGRGLEQCSVNPWLIDVFGYLESGYKVTFCCKTKRRREGYTAEMDL